MLKFLNPQYFALMVVAGVLILIYLYYRLKQRNRAARFADRHLFGGLLNSYRAASHRVWFVVFLSAFALIILALARPQTGSKVSTRDRTGAEIMLVVDVSRSMLTEDFKPNRLERTKNAIVRLLEKMQNDRVGMVVFAGEPYVQLPITSDYITAANFVKTISTDMVPVQGTSIASAIDMAVQSFSSESKLSRAIVLITDGESHDDDPLKAAEKAEKEGVMIHTIGVGTPEGSPISIDGQMVKDDKGDIVVSKLDQATLTQISTITKGLYVRSTDQSVGLNEIFEQIARMKKVSFDTVVYDEYAELYHYILYGVIALLVVGLFLRD